MPLASTAFVNPELADFISNHNAKGFVDSILVPTANDARTGVSAQFAKSTEVHVEDMKKQQTTEQVGGGSGDFSTRPPSQRPNMESSAVMLNENTASPNPTVMEKKCNLRRRAANSSVKKFSKLGYSGLNPDNELWVWRPRKKLSPEENLMTNPGLWKRGILVHSDDCGDGDDQCLGVRWRDGANDRVFTTPRWILDKKTDPREFGRLEFEEDGSTIGGFKGNNDDIGASKKDAKQDAAVPPAADGDGAEGAAPPPANKEPNDIRDFAENLADVIGSKFKKIFGFDAKNDDPLPKKELIEKLREGILETACHRFFAVSKGEYAKKHDNLTTRDAYHELRKFGLRIHKAETHKENANKASSITDAPSRRFQRFRIGENQHYEESEKSKEADRIPEDLPPEGITRDFCMEPEGGTAAAAAGNKKASSASAAEGGSPASNKAAKMVMKTRSQLLADAKDKIDIGYPKTVKRGYDFSTCDLDPAGEAVPRNHAPPAFRFLSPEDKETDTFSPELYKRYQKLFTDEPQCFFEDSPADCFLSSNQKGEKKTLLDELMKDGEDLGKKDGEKNKNLAFLYDVKSNQYAVCGATGLQPSVKKGPLHCMKLPITKYPIVPMLTTKVKGQGGVNTTFPLKELIFPYTEKCETSCRPKIRPDKMGICFLPDLATKPKGEESTERVFCREADDVLLVPERDRKLVVGSQVEVLDKSRGGKGVWLLGKVAKFLFPPKDDTDDLSGLGNFEDTGGSQVAAEAQDPRTSFEKEPCPRKTGCAQIDFLQPDGSLNRKLNVQGVNRIYPVDFGKRMRFPKERAGTAL
ncbi:unnamed protein product [Amoebophrya sp. A120]|nr:unnamed protein product [Amoebophrya sp. A120]|eukprot:GSA120T00016155001.1